MHALLVNDDGIFAPGIHALADCLLTNGWNVSLCAPDGQRSAAGHSITVHGELRVRRVYWPGAQAAYSVSGTPADCVRVALHTLVKDVDIVLSGINDGYNLGSDVVYSGTCAAAREAAMLDKPSMAVSTAFLQENSLPRTAQIAQRAARALISHPLAPWSMLNINVPGRGDIQGIRQAPLGVMRYDDEYVCVGTPSDEEVCYRLRGDVIARSADEFMDDVHCVQRGFATLTSIGLLRETEENLCEFLQECAFSPCKVDK